MGKPFFFILFCSFDKLFVSNNFSHILDDKRIPTRIDRSLDIYRWCVTINTLTHLGKSVSARRPYPLFSVLKTSTCAYCRRWNRRFWQKWPEGQSPSVHSMNIILLIQLVSDPHAAARLSTLGWYLQSQGIDSSPAIDFPVVRPW